MCRHPSPSEVEIHEQSKAKRVLGRNVRTSSYDSKATIAARQPEGHEGIRARAFAHAILTTEELLALLPGGVEKCGFIADIPAPPIVSRK